MPRSMRARIVFTLLLSILSGLLAPSAGPSLVSAGEPQDAKKEVQKLLKALEQQEQLNRELQEKIAVQEKQRKQALVLQQVAIAEAQVAKEEKEAYKATAKEAEKQVARVQILIEDTKKIIAQKDQQILALEQEKVKSLAEKQQAQVERDAALKRVQNLLDLIQQLQVEKAKAQQAPPKVELPQGKAPAPNPPPIMVKGMIEKVDPNDSSLVVISLGSDQGLAVGHTLEVYREKPAPKYLGMVRILQVTARSAVARLQPGNGVGNGANALQVGDKVASQMAPLK